MCGFCGIVATAGVSDVRLPEGDILSLMTEEIHHRGPDDTGFYLSENHRIALGFKRLKIIDLVSGHQPMESPDGSVHLVFNGEIYNYKELRQEHEKRGVQFQTHSDTETILHSYLQKGEAFIDDIDGMFSIALYDENIEKLFLVRDRMGKKPLYYLHQEGMLFFGSEIKSLLAHPEVKREINREALYHYHTFCHTPAPLTLFQGVMKLEAGHCATFNLKENSLTIKRYWHPPFGERDLSGWSEEEVRKEVDRLFVRAVEKRMMSDVPFGALLSGGIDSSLNVAVMNRFVNAPLNTFTIGYEGQGSFNEFSYAKQISKEFKTHHHEFIMNEQNFLDFLHDLAYYQDEPLSDPVCVPVYFVCKLARDAGITVVQVGEGSDEIFSGYKNYHQLYLLHRFFYSWGSEFPRFAKQIIASGGSALLSCTRYRKYIDILRRFTEKEPLFCGGIEVFTEIEKKELFTEGFLDSSGRTSSVSIVESILRNYPQGAIKNFIGEMTAIDLGNRLPELLLMRVDKMSMATSIEARAPFLDKDLVEFAVNIPPSLKVKNNEAKYILKRVAESYLSRDIIYRRKKGFGVPLQQWFMNNLDTFAKETIFNSPLLKEEQGIYNAEYLEQLLALHKKGSVNYAFHLWNFMNLSLWYKRWF